MSDAAGANPAGVRRDGARLLLSGRLDRAAVTALWPQANALLDGARTLDLHAVDAVDSAGLALLAVLAERLGTADVDGLPAHAGDLLAAYRLTPTLSFDGAR